MKKIKYIIICLVTFCGLSSCTDLDVLPLNIVNDEQIFGSEGGVESYLARVYSRMPMEDFRYGPQYLYNHFWVLRVPAGMTGEALCREMGGASTESTTADNTNTFSDQYSLIRELNYFLSTIDKYSSNFKENQINTWKGEMYCLRAFAYFQMVKRYGGVPIVTDVIDPIGKTTDEVNQPRDSEYDCWNLIASDFDKAIELLPTASPERGRVNKYVAYGLS
jgi:hypothetical protein